MNTLNNLQTPFFMVGCSPLAIVLLDSATAHSSCSNRICLLLTSNMNKGSIAEVPYKLLSSTLNLSYKATMRGLNYLKSFNIIKIYNIKSKSEHVFVMNPLLFWKCKTDARIDLAKRLGFPLDVNSYIKQSSSSGLYWRIHQAHHLIHNRMSNSLINYKSLKQITEKNNPHANDHIISSLVVRKHLFNDWCTLLNTKKYILLVNLICTKLNLKTGSLHCTNAQLCNLMKQHYNYSCSISTMSRMISHLARTSKIKYGFTHSRGTIHIKKDVISYIECYLAKSDDLSHIRLVNASLSIKPSPNRSNRNHKRGAESC